MTRLTERQAVILQLLAEGMVPKQAATELGIEHETVKHHLKLARKRLGARNTTHAVAIYIRARLLRAETQSAATPALPPIPGGSRPTLRERVAYQ